jgi:hypothetical protein
MGGDASGGRLRCRLRTLSPRGRACGRGGPIGDVLSGLVNCRTGETGSMVTCGPDRTRREEAVSGRSEASSLLLARGEQQYTLKSCEALGDLTQPGQTREHSDRLAPEQGDGRLALGEKNEFAGGAVGP